MKQTSRHIPTIAIVGRPNVGKSTLFNRLARRRIAIVDDLPGVTRDRLYAEMDHNGMVYHLIDTAGWVPEAVGELVENLRAQLEVALSEAEAIIFLLDGRDGINPADQTIVDRLRKSRKPVFFTVNKIDNNQQEKFVYEFYQLGVDQVFPISSGHGRGVAELMDAIVEAVPGAKFEEEESEESEVPRIAVIGRPNVGKSSLINRLLGEERLLVTSQPGTTRDTVDTEVEYRGKKYFFIDTAGIRRKTRIDEKLERISSIRAIKAIGRADLVLLMLDPAEGPTDQDAKLAGLLLRRGRAGIILLNKWDLVPNPGVAQDKIDQAVKKYLWHFAFAPVLPVSAKTGFGLDKLFPTIDAVFQQYQRKISTSELNRVLPLILKQTQLPNHRGQPLRIYYATQTKSRPPTFLFFVNYPEIIKEAFSRFLHSRLAQALSFSGTPLILQFRARTKKS